MVQYAPMMFQETFSDAVIDYYYLLNKKYSEKSALKLVGDRYGLGKDERNILYRGVCSQADGVLRKARMAASPFNAAIGIDVYNVICTIMNYRMGKPLFISFDGFLRDAGGTHGKIKDARLFSESSDQLFTFLARSGVKEVLLYIDSPVSHSKEHQKELISLLARYALKGECYIVKSADYPLKHEMFDLVATTDSHIIEQASCPAIDLARQVLEAEYAPAFPVLETMLSRG